MRPSLDRRDPAGKPATPARSPTRPKRRPGWQLPALITIIGIMAVLSVFAVLLFLPSLSSLTKLAFESTLTQTPSETETTGAEALTMRGGTSSIGGG
jgi:hypothetical protein